MIVTLVGLDFAGKTSIRIYLEKLNTELAMRTETSMRVEELRKKKVIFYVIPGQEVLRTIEEIYERLFPITDVIVFVVDAADRNKFNEAKEYFKFVLKMKKKYAKPQCRLLVLAHKQDKDAASPGLIADILGVDRDLVIGTSIKIPITMFRFLMKLHDVKVDEFELIATYLKDKCDADAVLIIDDDLFTYAMVFDKKFSELVTKVTENMINLLKAFPDAKLVTIQGLNKTCVLSEIFNENRIYVIVINARESLRSTVDHMIDAMKMIKREYIRVLEKFYGKKG